MLVCDCNANPDNPADPIFQNFPAYLLLKNAGFVDVFRTARPNDPGFTFGQAENLLNVTSTMSHRIDLVQFRGPFTIEDVQVVDASPADRDAPRPVAVRPCRRCRDPEGRGRASDTRAARE